MAFRHKHDLSESEVLSRMRKSDGGEDRLEIKIKYHTGITQLKKMPIGDWVDLRAAADTFIPYHEYVKISFGFSAQIPDGYEAHVVPRSSTFEKYGIIMVNSTGIIDNSYSGDGDIWHFPAYCLEWRVHVNGKKGTFIRKDDRIAQFRLMPNQPDLTFIEVDHLPGPNRGGFGSTGRR